MTTEEVSCFRSCGTISSVGQAIDLARDVVSGHHVEDHVGASAPGKPQHLGDEIVGVIIVGLVGAQNEAGGRPKKRSSPILPQTADGRG
jgi:hypothetical protein